MSYTLTLLPVDLTGAPITVPFGNLLGGGEHSPGESSLIQARINSAFNFKYWTIDSDVPGSKNIWKTTDTDYMVSVVKPNLIIKAVLDPTGEWAAVSDTDHNTKKLGFVNSAQIDDTKIKVLKDSSMCHIEETKVIIVN